MSIGSSTSEIHAELQRILESPGFRDSAALKSLLRHIVEETLAGRQDGLKEYNLGRDVFHRQPDYDPRLDAIVRVQASALRKKLAAFYEKEGADGSVRIDLPRGGYVPQFVETAPAEIEPPSVPALRSPVLPALPVKPRPARRRFAWGPFVLGAAAAALTMLAATRWTGAETPPAAGPLWSGMIASGKPVVVSLGIPLFFTGANGLYVRDVQANDPSRGPSPSIRALEQALGARFRVHEDVYTGVGEALGVASVSRWLDRRGVKVEVANSHYLGRADLRGRHAVIVSSLRFQTLLDNRELDLPFPFDFAGPGSLRNPNPLPGEQPVYGASVQAGISTSHAVVTLLPGAEPGASILQLGGTHSWSTSGAVQYALSDAHQAELDRRLRADPESGPRGKRSPFFQVLLELEGKYDQVRSIRYITHRYLPSDPR
ncbi:MAG: hypothetical protein R2729_09715 [Bryobacteraceae bacterium]